MPRTIHSTDMGGYPEAIFGITNMISVFYAPRIKGLSSQQLFGFGSRADYKTKKYPLLPDSSINRNVIEQNWEDILRLMVTLKSGKTTAYQIFKRLSRTADRSCARQNPLLKAIKEYGKIIKSGFMLRFYDELALRQAIEKQLSRIEMVNRFSIAVFFGNNGTGHPAGVLGRAQRRAGKSCVSQTADSECHYCLELSIFI